MIEVIEKCLNKILDGKIKEYPLLNLLTVYYQQHIDNTRKSQKDENLFPVELSTTLIKRESGIFEALEHLRRIDVNFDEGDFFNPLMVAVAEADAPMTEYLIVNGADPRYWPDIEEDEFPDQNYYYEDIDIAYLNEKWNRDKDFVNALLHTARVLSETGNLGDFHGLCLNVDSENHSITLSGLKLRF